MKSRLASSRFRAEIRNSWLSVLNAYGGQHLFSKHCLQQAFLQIVFYLALRGVFLALRVPACAQESLGTLPMAIYDMTSRGFACDLFQTHFSLKSKKCKSRLHAGAPDSKKLTPDQRKSHSKAHDHFTRPKPHMCLGG